MEITFIMRLSTCATTVFFTVTILPDKERDRIALSLHGGKLFGQNLRSDSQFVREGGASTAC